jgi:hypothetical protein
MSIDAVVPTRFAAHPLLPVRNAGGAGWREHHRADAATARLIEPARGTAPFVTQILAQEVLEAGRFLPRWREGAEAYAAPRPGAALAALVDVTA